MSARGTVSSLGQCFSRCVSVALLAVATLGCLALSCCGSAAPAAISGVVATLPRSIVSGLDAATPSPVLSPTPRPTSPPTAVVPVRLALPGLILSAASGAFEQIAQQNPSLIVESCGTSAQALHLWRSGQVDAAIVSTKKPAPDAVPLRSVPYVLVGAVTSRARQISPGELRGIYAGRGSDWQAVVCGDGRNETLLLGLDRIAPTCPRYETPEEALEYVAACERTLALLPWESVDFRVCVIPIGGHRLWHRPMSEYPYMLRWWLVGDLGEGLLGALHEGLACCAEEPLSLVAVGDIMLARYVGQIIAEESPTYPFENPEVKSVLAKADLAFGNLECPVSERGTQQDKGIEFRAAPAVLRGLYDAGFDVISLANNHTGDYGDVALMDTLDMLCAADILPVGAGGDLEEALSLRAVWVKGLRVGFLAFNDIGPHWFAATDNSPGSAWLDPETAVASVRAAAEETDLLLVSCHWGKEYTSYPTPFQKRIARELVEAGADLVVGHHPHVLQAVQYFDSGFVAYSLGNFVFDQFFGEDVRQGAILYCLADRSGLRSVELIPTYNWRAQPRVMEPEDAGVVLDRVFGATREIGGLPSGVR